MSQKREWLPQIITHHPSEDWFGAGACPIRSRLPIIYDFLNCVQILKFLMLWSLKEIWWRSRCYCRIVIQTEIISEVVFFLSFRYKTAWKSILRHEDIARDIIRNQCFINISAVRESLLKYFCSSNYKYASVWLLSPCKLKGILKGSSLFCFSFNLCIFRDDDVDSIWECLPANGIKGLSSHDDWVACWAWSCYFLEHLKLSRKAPWQGSIFSNSSCEGPCQNKIIRYLARHYKYISFSNSFLNSF